MCSHLIYYMELDTLNLLGQCLKLRHYPRKFRVLNTDILSILIDVEVIWFWQREGRDPPGPLPSGCAPTSGCFVVSVILWQLGMASRHMSHRNHWPRPLGAPLYMWFLSFSDGLTWHVGWHPAGTCHIGILMYTWQMEKHQTPRRLPRQ